MEVPVIAKYHLLDCIHPVTVEHVACTNSCPSTSLCYLWWLNMHIWFDSNLHLWYNPLHKDALTRRVLTEIGPTCSSLVLMASVGASMQVSTVWPLYPRWEAPRTTLHFKYCQLLLLACLITWPSRKQFPFAIHSPLKPAILGSKTSCSTSMKRYMPQ